MTAHSDDRGMNRWLASHSSPSLDLHQRKLWDTFRAANQTATADAATGLEVAAVGADLPPGRFALPDESPVFLPHNYEPNYAYPLVIWLHDAEWTARELLDLMPRISPQNYLGLAIAGASASSAHLLETLQDVVCQMRREVHVHSERIYVAGFGHQANVALSLLLRRPEWFAGVLAFGARDSKLETIVSNYDELRGKRVLLGAGIRDRQASLPEHASLGRMLRSAGLNVISRAYDSGEDPSVKLLSDIDHWLMDSIHDSTLV
jgi:phospholipase/carboxylesterase